MLRGLLASSVLFMVTVPAQAQDLPIIAVARMQDPNASRQAANLAVMLETAFVNTGNFRVFERDFAELNLEQDLANNGTITSNRSGQRGGFEGADFLIYGVITTWQVEQRGDGATSFLRDLVRDPNARESDCRNMRVRMAVDLRITDTSSGEIRFTESLDGEAESGTVCTSQAQVDYAGLFRSAAQQLANELSVQMYPIEVAAVQSDGRMVLTYGEGIVNVGDYLMVYQRGPEVFAANGRSLGHEEYELGAIRIESVQEGSSRALPVGTFTTPAQAGAIARIPSEEQLSTIRRADRNRGRNRD